MRDNRSARALVRSVTRGAGLSDYYAGLWFTNLSDGRLSVKLNIRLSKERETVPGKVLDALRQAGYTAEMSTRSVAPTVLVSGFDK